MRRYRLPISSGLVYLCFLTLLCLIAGVAILRLGFPQAGFDGPVLCDNQEMSPGDWCRTSGGGSVSTRTYEDLRAQQLAGHGWELSGLVIGGVMLLSGLLLLLFVVRLIRGRSGIRRLG